MRRFSQVPSVFRRVGVSLLIALTVALAGIGVEFLVDRPEHLATSLIDNVMVGVITALIVFAYEQRRHNAWCKESTRLRL